MASMIAPISVTTPPTISAASQGSTTLLSPYTAASNKKKTPIAVTVPPIAILIVAAFMSETAAVVSALSSSSSWANKVPTSLASRRNKLGVDKQLVPVTNTRGGIGKAAMIHNSATPLIEVDPETYEVHADGELLTCEPATILPMAQRYFLF